MKQKTKQTAVDFLMEKLFDPSTMVEEQIQWFEQAKEMEKEQIKDAYYNGTTDEIKTKEELIFEAEHFYNETYGNNHAKK